MPTGHARATLSAMVPWETLRRLLGLPPRMEPPGSVDLVRMAIEQPDAAADRDGAARANAQGSAGRDNRRRSRERAPLGRARRRAPGLHRTCGRLRDGAHAALLERRIGGVRGRRGRRRPHARRARGGRSSPRAPRRARARRPQRRRARPRRDRHRGGRREHRVRRSRGPHPRAARGALRGAAPVSTPSSGSNSSSPTTRRSAATAPRSSTSSSIELRRRAQSPLCARRSRPRRGAPRARRSRSLYAPEKRELLLRWAGLTARRSQLERLRAIRSHDRGKGISIHRRRAPFGRRERRDRHAATAEAREPRQTLDARIGADDQLAIVRIRSQARPRRAHLRVDELPARPARARARALRARRNSSAEGTDRTVLRRTGSRARRPPPAGSRPATARTSIRSSPRAPDRPPAPRDAVAAAPRERRPRARAQAARPCAGSEHDLVGVDRPTVRLDAAHATRHRDALHVGVAPDLHAHRAARTLERTDHRVRIEHACALDQDRGLLARDQRAVLSRRRDPARAETTLDRSALDHRRMPVVGTMIAVPRRSHADSDPVSASNRAALRSASCPVVSSSSIGSQICALRAELCVPTNASRSSSVTRRVRARCHAAERPAMPPPTTTVWRILIEGWPAYCSSPQNTVSCVRGWHVLMSPTPLQTSDSQSGASSQSVPSGCRSRHWP